MSVAGLNASPAYDAIDDMLAGGTAAPARRLAARARARVAVALSRKPDHHEPMTLPRASGYPVHARALERHAMWARDFAAAGELEASIDEIRDIRALASEFRTLDERVDRAGSS